MAHPDMASARQSAASQLKMLINNDLKEICRQENLQVSGVKSTLQARILAHMDDAINRGEMEIFERIRYRIRNRGAAPPPGYSGADTRPGTSISTNTASQHQSNQYSRPQVAVQTGPRAQVATTRLNFKPSPFYTIQDSLTHIKELPQMPANRHSVSEILILSDHVCERLSADPSLRIMLYCSPASHLASFELNDIAFPGQIEVKVNQDEVKSNYKGLKNKPGTTKPADLTTYLRKQPRYPNNLQINYALTQKKYSFVINLVKKLSAEELMDKISRGRIISKDAVLNEMALKARDQDIEATSSVMSLKDPVSTMRMYLPCRSTICTHIQCFDALCFLQLQEQAPTWTCPICSKTVSYEALAVDHYVLDILSRTAKSVEQVVIEPDGSWKEVSQNGDDQGVKTQPRASYDDDSDVDLVEISDVKSGVPLPKNGGQSATSAMGQHMTPPMSSREASVSQNGRNKRPSAVIDLTLSEDDEPPRPAKRPNVTTNYNTPSSNSDRSQEVQHRSAPTLYTGFTQMQSPPAASATSPRPPDTTNQPGQQMAPWPMNYNTSMSGHVWGGQY